MSLTSWHKAPEWHWQRSSIDIFECRIYQDGGSWKRSFTISMNEKYISFIHGTNYIIFKFRNPLIDMWSLVSQAGDIAEFAVERSVTEALIVCITIDLRLRCQPLPSIPGEILSIPRYPILGQILNSVWDKEERGWRIDQNYVQTIRKNSETKMCYGSVREKSLIVKLHSLWS